MVHLQQDLVEDNRLLRREFEEQGLSVDEVGQPGEGNPDAENGWLRELYRWVCAYRACPNRGELEKDGFLYPPIEPDIDPDTDWIRFERWIAGEPIWWNFVADFGALKAVEELTDEQIERELAGITECLAERGVVVELQEAVPARVAYGYLKKELEDSEFEFMGPGASCHLTGCTGYCPGCVQRPWCEMGQEMEWSEDEKAGHTVCPEEVVAYMR